MSKRIEVAPHPWSAKRHKADVLFEWGDDDAFTVELHIEETEPRENEGVQITADNGYLSARVDGLLTYTASITMTEAEAREMHAALGEVLGE